jgi:hypothetical protein
MASFCPAVAAVGKVMIYLPVAAAPAPPSGTGYFAA